MKKRLSIIVHNKKYPKKMTVIAVALLIMTGFIFFTLTGLAKENQVKPFWDSVNHQIIESALKAMQEGDFNGAEKIITNHLASKPEFIPDVLYLMLGKMYHNRKRLDDELNILKQGHKRYPDNEEINENLMNCYAEQAFENQEFIKAGKLFERLYETYPYNRSVLSMAVMSYFKANNLNEAKRVYKRMVDLFSDTDVMRMEKLIGTCTMLGLEDEAKGYKTQLREKGIYSDLLSSDKLTLRQGQNDNNDDVGNVYGYEPPKVIKHINPQYPVEAEGRKISGMVVIDFVVSKEGRVRDTVVIASEPEGVFDKSALEAIQQYRFKPGTNNDIAVDSLITASIRYNFVRAAMK